jgi:hypothetical protein
VDRTISLRTKSLIPENPSSQRGFQVLHEARAQASSSLPSNEIQSKSIPSEIKIDFASWDSRELVRYFEPICSKLGEDLFLGSRIPAANKGMLQSLGITHILNCAGGVCRNHFPDDFQYKTLYLLDGPEEDIISILYSVFDFMTTARSVNGKVFIHCHQGMASAAPPLMIHLSIQVFLALLPWPSAI